MKQQWGSSLPMSERFDRQRSSDPKKRICFLLNYRKLKRNVAWTKAHQNELLRMARSLQISSNASVWLGYLQHYPRVLIRLWRTWIEYLQWFGSIWNKWTWLAFLVRRNPTTTALPPPTAIDETKWLHGFRSDRVSFIHWHITEQFIFPKKIHSQVIFYGCY